MKALLPPIYRDCRRLLLHTEQVVRRFSRYHKYTVGTDLRQQAMGIMRGVHMAVYDRAHQAEHVAHLVWAVDGYKLTLQLCIELGAFVHSKARKPTGTLEAAPGFAAFETAAQLAATIGKQCGGWHRQTSAKAQALAPKPARKGTSAAGQTMTTPCYAVACGVELPAVNPKQTAVSPSVPVPVRFASLVAAWRRARRGKRPSHNQLAFDAPDFADRVVHHLLVERLERLYEPVFIFDSFANRKGKGSHGAAFGQSGDAR